MAKRSSRTIQRYEQKMREVMEFAHHHTERLAYTPWEQVEKEISVADVLPGDPEYDEIRALWESQQQKYRPPDKP
nr:hypothetical protein [Nitrosomonas nitrosa]